MSAVTLFRTMLQQIPPRLAKISSEGSAQRSVPDAWSARQELGHLLDSAIMNHQRLLRVLAEDNPTLSAYDGVFCVAAHDYHGRDWQELIATWRTLNQHLLWAIERVTGEQWQRRCVSEARTMTLEFLVEDYVHHALQHLQHMGVPVRDLGEPRRATA